MPSEERAKTVIAKDDVPLAIHTKRHRANEIDNSPIVNERDFLILAEINHRYRKTRLEFPTQNDMEPEFYK